MYKFARHLFLILTATAAVSAQNAPERSAHSTRFGVIAANTFYQDYSIQKGLFSGFYRPYFKYVYDKKFETLVRGNLTAKRYLEAPANGSQQTSINGALEIFSFEMTLGRHRVNAGRNFFITEQGILFSNFADGASYTGTFEFGTLRAMALHSGEYGTGSCMFGVTGCSGDTNAFVSTPTLAADSGVQNSGRRAFGVVDYSTPEFFGSVLSGHAMVQKDLITEAAANTTRYEYNPYYFGVAAQGYIANANYRYRIDGIYQGGSVFNAVANGVSDTAKIQAYAVLANFTWIMPVLTKIDPQLLVDFAMGSGDGDSTSVSTPSQSNTSGNYTAFQAYGSYSGGLALKPRLTNMTIYRGGVQFRPVKFIYALRNLGMQIKYSKYMKTVAAGGISDAYATESNADVGQAIDAAVTFSARSDLQFFYGFGWFKPGAAYPTTNSDGTSGTEIRTAHLVSLTLVF